MNIDKKLDRLKEIKEVAVPPFLLTRIKQHIQSLQETPAPVKWKWAFAGTAIFILALNLSIVLKSSETKSTEPGIENVVKSMHLSSSNNLYYE